MEIPTRTRDAAPMPRRVYNGKEVTEITGSSWPTVRRWIKSGRLPAKRIGDQWFIPADALDKFLGPEDAA
jgi:excisionase family DNA binding protein